MTSAPFVLLKDLEKRWNGKLGVEEISLEIPEGGAVRLMRTRIGLLAQL